MPTLPNPWVLLGAVVLVIGLLVGDFFWAQHLQLTADQAAVDKQKIEAANILAASNAKLVQTEKDYDAAKDEIEQLHQAHAIAITKALADNRSLLDQLYSVQQPGRGKGGADQLPAVATAACRSAGPAARIVLVLPKPDAEHLVSVAQVADSVVADDLECRAWIGKLTAITNGK